MRIREPLAIKSLKLRNRIVMPPMATSMAENGAPSEKQILYYAERAKTVGLIIVEHAYVSSDGIAHASQLSMADDAVIPAYRRLTDAVKAQGCRIFAQLNHAGAQARDTGLPCISPSGIPVREGAEIPEIMTEEDIARIREDFITAARRAREAGFDGVEIHSAHGYLLNQFYSPVTNHRTDAYGNTLEGRTRLHTEILAGVREAMGLEYPVAIRFGACDYLPRGSRKEEIPQAVHWFAKAGADLIDISGGLSGFTIQGVTVPGWFSDLSALAKAGTEAPVLVTGGITKAEEAEELLKKGAADLVGVGRALLKDPAWAEKALGKG